MKKLSQDFIDKKNALDVYCPICWSLLRVGSSGIMGMVTQVYAHCDNEECPFGSTKSYDTLDDFILALEMYK